MKEEILRFDRVTSQDQGAVALSDFCLHIFAGEIVGLVPVNSTGIRSLLRLLRQNLPLHYGYIYYRDKLVNDWLHSDGTFNRVGLIEGRSGLADDLTVADNVFVLRPGFGKSLISRRVLARQLRPFLDEIGVELSSYAYPYELSAFERYVVELVKAVVAGCKLIVLIDAGTTVSDAELSRLHDILRHYAAKGLSFLYVAQHYEEVRSLSGRAAFMMNGQIVKVLNTRDVEPEALATFGIDQFNQMIREQSGRRAKPAGGVPAIEFRALQTDTIDRLSLAIAPGECVVMQDLDNRMLGDLLHLLSGDIAANSGEILVSGQPRYARRAVAIIQKQAPQTMLFPHLSYLDNLLFTMDHRLPRVWMSAKTKNSVRRETELWLGADVFDKRVEELTTLQKYDLIYARVLLQKPSVVFCVQPFMQADVEQRMHIWTLLERLLARGIAVVILAVNLADTLSVADRLVRIKDGRVDSIYARDEFGVLPGDTPWRHLWPNPGSPERAPRTLG